MIIIKDVPGLTPREILETLEDINPGSAQTGHGGFVTDEATGYEFLRAYLIASEKLPAEPIREPEPVFEMAPVLGPVRRGGRRKAI